VYAIIGAVFHVVIVVIPFAFVVFSDNCCREDFVKTYSLLVWHILYFPFQFIFSGVAQYFPEVEPPGTIIFFMAFTSLGTFLYAASGWLIGYMRENDTLWHKIKEKLLVIRLFPHYKRSTVYALVGGTFHFLLIALIFFLEFIGLIRGENALGYLVVYMDLPLFLIEQYFRVFTSSRVFFILGGTLLYALVGWFIGFIVDKFYADARKLVNFNCVHSKYS